MSEDDWATCTDPDKMLAFLRGCNKLSERKARLFAVACCRRIWPLLTDERSRKAAEVTERFADDVVGEDELYESCGLAWEAVDELHGGGYVVEHATRAAAWAATVDQQLITSRESAAINTAGDAERAATAKGAVWAEEVTKQCNLLRDLIGPLPFRSLPPLERLVRAWNDGCVVKLATAIYEERVMPAGTLDPGRLAVLADALEEAGCTDPDILGHLRQQGAVHVRGCFVIDLLTGRK